MNTKSIIDSFAEFVMPNYPRLSVVIAKGKGSKVWDSDGKEYLDLFPGWGVSAIGYNHPKVVKAIKDQVEKLIHMPNNFYNELQGELAKVISQRSFQGKCFFCNSGAEAVEAAMKLARKYGSAQGKTEIITMLSSFHGRTFGAMTATGQPKYQKEFMPIVPGVKHVPFGDFDAVEAAVTDKTCAILIEPIQGEGGINIAAKEYFRKLRKLCSEKDIVLIFDEVQTGCGRTGRHFAFQHLEIEPDVMTLAKALGGGFPIGAIIAGPPFSDVLQPGNHASTFGGSPLACAASLAVFQAIDEDDLLKNTSEMGDYLMKRLIDLKQKFPFIKEVRGLGLMVGMEVEKNGPEIVKKCLDRGLIINCTAGSVVRFLPSMAVTKEELDQGLAIIENVINKLTGEE